jgi:microcystin-dependent protein
MASPITSEDFDNQNINGPLCDQFREKLLNNDKIAQLLDYLFDADGNIAADFMVDLKRSLMPIGTLRMSAAADSGAVVEDGAIWLPCGGAAYARADYPELEVLLGETYNVAGDNQAFKDDYFRTPNTAGRFLLGSGTSTASGATAHAIASYGGEETHVLTLAELAAHDHGGGVAYARGDFSPADKITEEQAVELGLDTLNAGIVHEDGGHTYNSNNTIWGRCATPIMNEDGEDTAHNTMPPHVTCACYILAGYKANNAWAS